MAAAGPEPLIRHGADGRLRLQQQGLKLLRRAGAPVHVVFAVGGSRCGKSTAGNALIFGPEPGGCGFVTGSSFDPVTTGVDVAVRLLPGGGALVVGDCEGAFHVCGSAQSARGFGALGVLAYHLSSSVLHVSMGSIDERDIEVIGHLAASACAGCRDASEPAGDDIEAVHALPPPPAAPALVLLVNGARFDLGDAVARRLLKPPEGGGAASASRWCARAAIARGFQEQPALEALPACEHAAYWPKVDSLRRRLTKNMPVLMANGEPASGADLAERAARLVAALNGEAQAMVAQLQPEPATEVLFRTAHLEPLIEEISSRYAAGCTGGRAVLSSRSAPGAPQAASPGSCALEEALAEFDRRTAWLTSPAGSTGSGRVQARDGLVAEMRARLATRLAGLNEAVARGRQQGAARRPRLSRRPSLTEPRGSSPASTEKENWVPTPARTPPGTPSKRSNFEALQKVTAEVERKLEQVYESVAEDVSQLKVAAANMQQHVDFFMEKSDEGDRQASATVASLKDKWRHLLGEAADDRVRVTGTEVAAANAALAELRGELRAVEELLPDVGECAEHLSEIRSGLEAERLRCREAADLAARALEGRVRRLREDLDEGGGALTALKEQVRRRFTERMQEVQAELEDEHHQRRERYSALAEVVDRLRASLEASVEVGEPPPHSAHRGGRTQAGSAQAAQSLPRSRQLAGRRARPPEIDVGARPRSSKVGGAGPSSEALLSLLG